MDIWKATVYADNWRLLRKTYILSVSRVDLRDQNDIPFNGHSNGLTYQCSDFPELPDDISVFCLSEYGVESTNGFASSPKKFSGPNGNIVRGSRSYFPFYRKRTPGCRFSLERVSPSDLEWELNHFYQKQLDNEPRAKKRLLEFAALAKLEERASAELVCREQLIAVNQAGYSAVPDKFPFRIIRSSQEAQQRQWQ